MVNEERAASRQVMKLEEQMYLVGGFLHGFLPPEEKEIENICLSSGLHRWVHLAWRLRIWNVSSTRTG